MKARIAFLRKPKDLRVEEGIVFGFGKFSIDSFNCLFVPHSC